MTTKKKIANLRKTKKSKFRKNNYTMKQRSNISNQIYDITDQDVFDDFTKLVEIGCEKHAALSKVGHDVVNRFTAVERLNTVGNKGINFYDVWFNKKRLKKEFINIVL